MSSAKCIKPRKSRKEWIGKRFGNVVVISRQGSDRSGSTWLCKCDCGLETIKNTSNLRAGKACVKCGYKKTGDRSRTHGMSKTPIYKIWAGMIKRCEDRKSNRYYRYGGRGIAVCKRWRESFEGFLKDMGERPSLNHSIDRINNDGDYEPSNCRWANTKIQANNRSDNRFLTSNGKTQSVYEWSKETGINQARICDRLSKGWSIERALTTPVKEGSK